MGNSALDEGARLHRAKRAAAARRRDEVLAEADRHLADLRVALARALLAFQRGREDVPVQIDSAMKAADRARLVLRDYFDGSTR